MAENMITLRIHIPSDNKINPNGKTELEMSIGSKKIEDHLQVKNSPDKDVYQINISIQDISFQKKMYSPNVIKTELHIKNSDQNSKLLPTKNLLTTLFLNRKVEMSYVGDSKNSICDDYYVQKIEPRYLTEEVYLSLTIYSPDYQMTLDDNCQAFVAKRLGKIITEKEGDFLLPYDQSKHVKIDFTNLQHIAKDEKDPNDENKTIKNEHIFPYLVQYNESFYDFLKRTTNRWGEFLYYEDGQLNVGYDNSASPTEVKDFYCRTYCAIDASSTSSNGSKIHTQATADMNMLNNPMTKGKYDTPKGLINSLGDKDLYQDKYIMSKISSFFGNNKPLGTWAINTVIDDLVAWGIAEKKSKQKNDKFNNTYFKSATAETTNQNNDDKNKDNDKDKPNDKDKKVIDETAKQYNSDRSKFNPFSEIDPMLTATDYANLLKMEMTAGRDAMLIEFQTTYPNLRLGQKIQVAGENYLVVEFRGYQSEKSMIFYEATCVSSAEMNYTKKDKNEKEETVTYSGFFPPLLETGHVRKSGLQHAVVTNTSDPLRANRVRVKFDWQDTDKDVKEYSPWLLFAQSAATDEAGIHGRHYKNEKVLVDFINGNIERPYVIGAVDQKTPTTLKTDSVTIQSPAGHGMCITDGPGSGYTAFLASITPGVKMLQGMFPGKDPVSQYFKLNEEETSVGKRFEGNTEICDYYGIYSIKGSTDNRNITIKSPWGDVKINAFTGITVSAPNGDIKLQGKNVTIEAGNNLKLISGTNIKNKFMSRASSDSGDNALSVLDDIALIVAKKIQDLALSPIDLSLIRNILEVGFKPQEGLLEVQSNRFLKLEAGGAKAGYPAYNDSYRSKEAMEKALKDGAKTMLEMGPAIAGLLYKIDPWVNDLIKNYTELYQKCISKKQAFESVISELKKYAQPTNEANPVYFNDYNALTPTLWKKDTNEIKDTDLNFNNDLLDISDNAHVSPIMVNRFGSHQIVQKKRKELRKKAVKSANDLLKSIQNLRQVKVSNHKTIWDVGYFYGFFTKYVPKNYMDAFKKAVALDSLKGTYYYKMLKEEPSAEFKALTDDQMNVFNNYLHKLALKRKIAVNLLTGWGIKDFFLPLIPFEINPEGNVALNEIPAPAIIPEDEEQLLDPATWNAYVSLLTVKNIPAMERDLHMIGIVGTSILDHINIVRPVQEYYSWGKAKNGKILFSDNRTYQLGKKIEPVATKYNQGKYNRAQLGKGIDPKIEKFMNPITDALKRLGAVAIDDWELVEIPEGNNNENNNQEQ